MRSWPIRTLLLGLVVLAAGGLAEIRPDWLGLPAQGQPEATSAAARAPDGAGRQAARSDAGQPTEGASAGESRTTTARGPRPPHAADPARSVPAGSGSLRVTRDELELFADLVVDAAAAPVLAAGAPVLAAAPVVAVPTPVRIASGLSAPIFATAIPGDERVFIVLRSGSIVILRVDGSIAPTPFLEVDVSTSGEGGLLGMAFAPDHATSGDFYVYYTAASPFRSVLARYTILKADPSRADPNSEQILLEVDQPQSNHNGGTIAFSPLDDDNLYVGLGDGGGSNDPDDEAQDPATLLGSMLRLDVSGGSAGYEIPSDNPFVGDAEVLDEIWSLGLRNPFRWSFDAETGDLWIGDVGQNAREEIDLEPPDSGGRNYQWDFREGSQANASGSSTLSKGVSTPPELDYAQAAGICNTGGSGSVTGGIVYRGPLVDLQGLYFYADYCQDRVWSYHEPTQTRVERTGEFGDAKDDIVAFGEDGFGAMLVVGIGGSVYRVGPGGDQCSNGIDDDLDEGTDRAEDLGCSSPTDPSELDPGVACDDGIDNDGDGDIDYPDDLNCDSATAFGEIGGGAECANGIDDDGDGVIDFPDDPGCSDIDDPSELNPNVQCDDGVDNDDDGDVDHPNDANCENPSDNSEAPASSSSDCGLGFELVFVVPLLAWARRRRRAASAA